MCCSLAIKVKDGVRCTLQFGDQLFSNDGTIVQNQEVVSPGIQQ